MKNKFTVIEIDPDFAKAVEETDGYCPCAVNRNEDTICPCLEFREMDEEGQCICGRYEKVISNTETN